MQWELSLFGLAEATTPGVGSPIRIAVWAPPSRFHPGSPVRVAVWALPFWWQNEISLDSYRGLSPSNRVGALPIESQCEPYVWAQWGLSLSESLWDPPCSYPWRLSRSDCSVSPPIRTSGLEVPGSSVPRVQRALTSLCLPNPRFGSTVTLRLSVLRRLPLSVAGGGFALDISGPSPLRTKGTLPHPGHLGPLVIWLHRASWCRCAAGCSPAPHSNLQSWDTPAGVLSESHCRSSATARRTLTKLPSAGVSPLSFLKLKFHIFWGVLPLTFKYLSIPDTLIFKYLIHPCPTCCPNLFCSFGGYIRARAEAASSSPSSADSKPNKVYSIT